ncbi:MAG: ABC transporter ATP-binding protein [Lachnospiraceae bacterium]|nr:ABC transporter ATP-binding protein [Lachnospiraceae bacterium]
MRKVNLMSELVKCTNLCKSYGKKEVIKNLNLTIGRGKIIGLLGPNGSGKTTLMKLFNGLLQPSSGEIMINGQEPGIESKKIISYLPDKMYFADWMKVKDLMDFFEDFYMDFQRTKAEEMCARLGISMNDKIKKLSKGNKEKVQLILVMSRKAELYLLDEPIAGVDPAARDYILDTILTNYNEEGTILISTHLISDIEKILDEVIMIRDGQIYIHQSVDDLREESGMSVDGAFRDLFKGDVYSQVSAGGEQDVR